LGNNISINYQNNPDDLIISLDSNLIEQVLINLIKNAIEALNETTEPEINITAEKSLIRVSDNGPGIEPELLDEVFVPFFSTKVEGSGIGLSLSRQIMRLHGGSILVYSTKGTTTFQLIFDTT